MGRVATSWELRAYVAITGSTWLPVGLLYSKVERRFFKVQILLRYPCSFKQRIDHDLPRYGHVKSLFREHESYGTVLREGVTATLILTHFHFYVISKITIELSASIAFEVVNWSEYALRL